MLKHIVECCGVFSALSASEFYVIGKCLLKDNITQLVTHERYKRLNLIKYIP